MYKHTCIKCDKVKLRGRSFFCRCCNLTLIAVSMFVVGVLVLMGYGPEMGKGGEKPHLMFPMNNMNRLWSQLHLNVIPFCSDPGI